MEKYGKQLKPNHSLRKANGIEGIRQKVIVIHNPSKIDQNQLLLVRFPNLGIDDVIIPGMANLCFNIELTATTDLNRTLVSNIGRAIIKQLAVKFEGNEILSIDNYDVFACLFTETYGKLAQKREMLPDKESSLMTVTSHPTA